MGYDAELVTRQIGGLMRGKARQTERQMLAGIHDRRGHSSKGPKTPAPHRSVLSRRKPPKRKKVGERKNRDGFGIGRITLEVT